MAFKDLKVTVTKVAGNCSRMCVGNFFYIRNARLEIPPEQSICIFALSSLIPALASSIIRAEKGESMMEILDEWQCPDPFAEVIFKFEEIT